MSRVLPAAAATLLLIGCSGGEGCCSEVAAAANKPAPKASSMPSVPAQARPVPQKPRGLPANALRVQQVEILDRSGFERPISASFGFIPLGWKAQGGVQWGQQFMCTNGYNVNWTAVSPDGAQTIAVLPQERWETNNYGAPPGTPGCPSAPITSSQQYLTQLAGRWRPGARVLDYRPRPDIAAKFAHLNMRTPSAMGEMRTWVEAGQVEFSFDEQGRAMRGVISAATIFSLSRMAGMGRGTMDALTGFTLPVFAATAPEGRLNLQFVEAIRQSFLANPEWELRIAQHNSAISRVAQEEIRKRAKIFADYSDYVSRIRQETAEVRARSDERRQRQYSEALRGTQSYDDPDAPGGRAELSGMYNHAWRLNDGTYVLSNDASFEPWRDLGVEGRRLEQTK